jgi:hypothetical protein
MRRTSHQHGSLKLADRRKGKVWEFRWREVQIDGSVCRKNIVVGTLEEFPTESAAQSAVDAIRLTINRQTPQQLLRNVSVETLVKHYQEHELPDIFSKQKPATGSSDEHHKSYSTQYAYDIYLKKWVLPRWRSYRLSEVKAVDVEAWLKTMPLARGSRAKIRNLMSALFSHAIRWEWTERNPIKSVRQSAKRMRTPDVLTPDEIMALLKELPEPLRTASEWDAFTGSEGGTGAPTSCEQSHYAGSLRSGGYAEQAAGAKQTCLDGAQQGRSTGLTGPNWTMTQIAISNNVGGVK